MWTLCLFLLSGLSLSSGLFPVRLGGGWDRCSGRVEIQYNNSWGSVCDDHWNIQSASIVCKQLNCGYALEALHNAYFEKGSGKILMDDVKCSGGEQYLYQCSHRGWGIHDCREHEDAGIICSESSQSLAETNKDFYHLKPSENPVATAVYTTTKRENSDTYTTATDADSGTTSVTSPTAEEDDSGSGSVSYTTTQDDESSSDSVTYTSSADDNLSTASVTYTSLPDDNLSTASVIYTSSPDDNLSTASVTYTSSPDDNLSTASVIYTTSPDDNLSTASVIYTSSPDDNLSTASVIYTTSPDDILSTASVIYTSSPDDNLSTASVIYTTSPDDNLSTASVIYTSSPDDNLSTASVTYTTSLDDILSTASVTYTSSPDDNLSTASVIYTTLPDDNLSTASVTYTSSPDDNLSTASVTYKTSPDDNLGSSSVTYTSSPDDNLSSASVTYTSSPDDNLSSSSESVSTNCGGILNSISGIITSPLYPNNYPPNSRCKWTIQTSAEYIIEIHFQHFQLEPGQNCRYDSVAVYEGIPERSALLGRICHPGNYTFYSSSNIVGITFRSDFAVEYTGFYAVFTSIQTPSSFPEIYPVRLVGGLDKCAGRIEMNYQDTWGTVCDDFWTIDNANIVCKQLNCGSATEALSNAYFGPNVGNFILDDVRCVGTERYLWQCPHRGFGSNDCSPVEEVGLICSESSQRTT